MDCLVKISDDISDEWCDQFCLKKKCILEHCPVLFEFPPVPILFGHVRLMYESAKVVSTISLPSYVCYNEVLCKDFLPATVHLNDSTCRHIDQIGLREISKYKSFESLVKEIKEIFRTCTIIPNGTYDCNHANAYRCENSTKCISKYRLVDGIKDCPFQDDETFNASCTLNDSHSRFQCFNDEKRCFVPLIVGNKYVDCPEGDDEEPQVLLQKQHHIYFQTICDGQEDLIPITIGERNETDETECEYWACNSTYNRCDGIWACYNGADEVNCEGSTCPPLQHMCVFPSDRNKVQCLPINRTGDGVIDCIGGSDERQYCRTLHSDDKLLRFYCSNDSKCIDTYDLCNGNSDCLFADDEQFCGELTTEFKTHFSSLNDFDKPKSVYFVLHNILTYPPNLISNPSQRISASVQSPLTKTAFNTNFRSDWAWRCNRGIDIRVRMSDYTNESHNCLCPPSYYGDTCQYQNQRVSVTLQLRVASAWRTLFTALILLINHEGKIESHDQIEYLPIRDCQTKFHIYLLYSTRPKDYTNNYSVHIDVFNKFTLKYHASWTFPILFPFLPVYPLAIQLTLPILPLEPVQDCPFPCVHGQCTKYTNTQNTSFCRCDPGWSGSQCTIQHRCNCALGSLCINPLICLCPYGTFGSRCFLRQQPCQSDVCSNNGRCVADYVRPGVVNANEYTCICSQGYTGSRCELRETRIDLSFMDSVVIPESLFIHFIETQAHSPHIQTILLKRIPLDQASLTIYTSIIFNIAFVQLQNNYYLIILSELPMIAANISTQITLSQQCASVQDSFDGSIANQHLLRRIKHYHIPCQHRNELVCFYDDIHMCLCDLSRHANCFKFEHNATHDCYGLNPCENEGQCFQDDPKCPSSSICVCDKCFYGTRCQFSTKGFSLSLDVILGYQIRPNVPLSQQFTVVKVAIVFTITIYVLGTINGLMSIITFREKETRTVGCGLYLLISSITSIITMNVLLLKVRFLVASQMGLITSQKKEKKCETLYIMCAYLDWRKVGGR
ncbi:unnamed protein product [Rotaria sp. Silwood2]|nr:unnamed protein product [Rotaria sp. Silwood2]